jgi:hypothetical protein
VLARFLHAAVVELDALDRVVPPLDPFAPLEAALGPARDRPEARVVVREAVAHVGRAGARQEVVGQRVDWQGGGGHGRSLAAPAAGLRWINALGSGFRRNSPWPGAPGTTMTRATKARLWIPAA